MIIENLLTLKANVERTIEEAIGQIQRLKELELDNDRLLERNRELSESLIVADRELHDLKNKARIEAGILI